MAGAVGRLCTYTGYILYLVLFVLVENAAVFGLFALPVSESTIEGGSKRTAVVLER